MELKGKKIAFLGDSITQGVGTSADEHIFLNVIARETGAECFNYGRSGTRIAWQRDQRDLPADAIPFYTRVEDMIPDADVVVVFGGTNDFGHGDAPMGTMSDRREDTFYGAYHVLMEKLIVKYPTAQLIVMTPLHRLGEEDMPLNERKVRRAATLGGYVQAIRQVAEFYGVPVVDLYANCMIQPRVPVLQQMYLPDGLHPSDAGNALIAKCLLSTLKAL